jgi:predicted MPP superfamily phosphohydrolase
MFDIRFRQYIIWNMFSAIMTDKNADKIFVQLEKRLGYYYLKNRLNAEKWHTMFKRLMGRVIFQEDMDPKYIFLKLLLVLAGSYNKTRSNTLNYKIDYQTVSFDNLPEKFNGFKILHLSDIHIEGIPDKGKSIAKLISGLEYDLCLITGDYRFLSFGECLPTVEKLKAITKNIVCKYGITGILGNHDSINMVPELESIGIRMLINESYKLEEGDDCLWVAGVDNPSFHTCASISRTLRRIPEEGFTILLAHSPGLLREAMRRNVNYYLCGHTHGGQLCLPGGRPIITKAKCERRYAIGLWNYKGMKGYTSKGLGESGLPVRLNCPPEITIHTLVRN